MKRESRIPGRPLFHYFQFPELAAFKFFFWEKTLFEFPQHEDKRFRIDDTDQEIIDLGQKILRSSITIPTIEIWNEDTFNNLFTIEESKNRLGLT